MNKVILAGRLGQDPEVRYTQSGKAVCTFNLAVNRRVASGAHLEADWVPIVIWEKLAEICGNNLLKGSRILVEGRLQIRTYEANDGQKRRIAEVVAQSVEFLEKKRTPSEGNADAGLTVDSFGKDVFPDEEIPF
ncbi:Single-stranded DNA-binding protein ssb [Sporomusa ovata DSM 2662]|uniref:Single-stranded DNA-binding protein n=1 Tax=Sporomusa ovata TaxID=2378 RepID=A0A0U1KVQ5_9FIRM|nr:single-stranded DNA-binding protein [Sporomusa ovata]EQB29324.1 single-stranded DNA-binding protein 2 [Sporomusa ovata DSM 2662]CQR71365.1 Single-stranded DNA-binding protein [Sporomusa ovata]